MSESYPLVSFCMATRNRRDMLLTALESCCAQDVPSKEVLVFDDASSDGTRDAVEARFPDVRYFMQDRNRGIAYLRDQGLREARGKYVFSVDDDAYYTGTDTVRQAVDYLESHPGVAVAAMRYYEPFRQGPVSQELAAARNGDARLKTFVSCAYGIRRDLALAAGGYRTFLFYRGEERDLSIRLLDGGYEIAYVDTPPVIHLYSPDRNWTAMTPYGIRNTLLFDYLNIPHPYVFPVLAVNCVQLYKYKLRLRECLPKLWYVVRGLGSCARYARERKPVFLRTYKRFRSLPAHGAEPAPPGERPPPATR